jgi:hypothetical protein
MSQQPAPQGDWAAQAAATIERVVGQVRATTTQPVIKIARVVVFGILAAVLVTAALVILSIAVFRVLTYLPGGVWVAYLISGLVFVLAGVLCMVKRHSGPDALDA